MPEFPESVASENSPQQRVYLDHAATSWPKPPCVSAAVNDYMTRLGASAGRGAYREAEEVERLIQDARQRAAKLLGAEHPRQIVFGFNGTDVLNQALLGFLRPGDHVVTSVLEHNSILRPLRWLEMNRDVQVTRVGCGRDGRVDPDEVIQACRDQTRLIALVHASNVTGVVQPIETIGRRARGLGVPLLVDAAQTAGHLSFSVQSLHADFVAAPTHKGLLGPLGGGLLYIRPGREQELTPLRFGGTGTESESDQQPLSMPQRFEAGSLNAPAIIGLGQGLRFLEQTTMETVQRHELRLGRMFREGLQGLPGVRVLADHGAHRLGVVSLMIQGYDPREAATLLDSVWGVQVRAGFHCSPLQHAALGTANQGGAVRFSFGVTTTEEEIQQGLAGVAALAANAL